MVCVYVSVCVHDGVNCAGLCGMYHLLLLCEESVGSHLLGLPSSHTACLIHLGRAYVLRYTAVTVWCIALIASYNSCEYTKPTLLQGLVDASRELQVLRGAPVRPSEHSTGVQSQDWQPLPTVAWHTISTAYQIIMTTKLNSLSTDDSDSVACHCNSMHQHDQLDKSSRIACVSVCSALS